MIKILLLEDDVVLSDIITDFLEERYSVESVYSSDAAANRIENERFDLFIFDINVMGRQNGLELLRELRAFNDTTPAIIITAYSDIDHLKKAFTSGANDFIRKPFELEELGVRIENIKHTFALLDTITIDPHTVFSPATETIRRNNETIRLTPKDAKILHYLIKNAPRSVSSQELLQNIWDFETMPSEATLRSHIRTLREIVGKEHIQTLRGIGYKWIA